MRVPVYCSSRNPLGHSISAGAETSPAPDSARTRFLIRAGIRSAPDRVNWRGHEPATRGAGDICLPGRSLALEGKAEPASAPRSPVARDYPSPRFRPPFQAAVRLAVLSRNDGEDGVLPLKSHV